MQGIIAFILIFFVVVTIHEFGHFIAAKRAGILCQEFAIGMGPKIFHKKIGRTLSPSSWFSILEVEHLSLFRFLPLLHSIF